MGCPWGCNKYVRKWFNISLVRESAEPMVKWGGRGLSMRTATEAANRVMSKTWQNEVQTFKEGVEGTRNEARTEIKLLTGYRTITVTGSRTLMRPELWGWKETGCKGGTTSRSHNVHIFFRLHFIQINVIGAFHATLWISSSYEQMHSQVTSVES